MTLSLMAAVRAHLPHLLFGLDAFRDHGFVEAGAEAGDGANDGFQAVIFFPKTLNERLVDLDLVEGKFCANS